MNNRILFLFILFVSFFVYSSDDKGNIILSKDFFKPSNKEQNAHVVANVRHIGVSDFEKTECPPEKICLHLPAWQIYELDGYLLPEREDSISIKVAHWYGAALITDTPWLARLEEISDPIIRKKLDADYILVGVELGNNIFCPGENDKKLFQKWEANFINKGSGKECFSF